MSSPPTRRLNWPLGRSPPFCGMGKERKIGIGFCGFFQRARIRHGITSLYGVRWCLASTRLRRVGAVFLTDLAYRVSELVSISTTEKRSLNKTIIFYDSTATHSAPGRRATCMTDRIPFSVPRCWQQPGEDVFSLFRVSLRRHD